MGAVRPESLSAVPAMVVPGQGTVRMTVLSAALAAVLA